jgi:5,10-methylenetetrahydromethanopterin reductase
MTASMKRPLVDLGLLPQDSVIDAAALAEEAETLGFDGIWIADSPGVFREAFVTLAACALATRRIRLATGVTNPVTRDPAVLAGACATLAEASDGRMVLGIGVGESAVYNSGRAPASLGQLEDAVRTIRELTTTGESVAGDVVRKMSWRAPHLPIVVAASGPRTLRLAGRIADGVLFQVGAVPSLVAYALEQIALGAAEAGRSLSEIEISARLACVVDGDADVAREEMRTYAAVAANTVVRTVPPDVIPEAIRADLDRLRDAYDYAQHGYSAAPQRDIVTDEILEAVTIAGSPEVVTSRLQALVELGVGRFVIPLVVSDKRRLMTTLSEEVLPRLALRSASPLIASTGGGGCS